MKKLPVPLLTCFYWTLEVHRGTNSLCFPQDHLVSVLGVASTVAHELGHNLGMSHDTAERHCSCQNEQRLGGCIMEPSTGSEPEYQHSVRVVDVNCSKTIDKVLP